MNRAIIHIDGDAFFASCEQARNPLLKDKPVVTGKERGIAASMSYEAKRKGVTRGMRLFEIRAVCPDAIILPSDYELYSIISKRFVAIVRRYTSAVEEYSIDECFADLTGMDKPLGMNYEGIARQIQSVLLAELDCSFSVGLAPTKVLAKVGSKWHKPGGLTLIEQHTIPRFLSELPVQSVWGIGGQTTALLERHGIRTALEFVNRPFTWVHAHVHKPFQEIWQELNGQAVLAIDCEELSPQYSIQKVRTFTPPSCDRRFIFALFSRNIENACIKARRHGRIAREVTFFLRTQDFHHTTVSVRLPEATSTPSLILPALEETFPRLFRSRVSYRATGVTLSKLIPETAVQPDLFGAHIQREKLQRLYKSVDAVDRKFGKHTVFAGSSFYACDDHLSKRKHVRMPLFA